MQKKTLLEPSEREIEHMIREHLGPDDKETKDVRLLYESATILYQFGLRVQDERFFLVALNKMLLAYEGDRDFFEQAPEKYGLWGNILLNIGKLIIDHTFVERSLDFYTKASQASIREASLFWHWGEAWFLIGLHSGEISDLQCALNKFKEAEALGCSSPHFQVDYATCLKFLGMQLGDPAYLEEGLKRLRKIISNSVLCSQEEKLTARAWTTYAFICQKRFSLTHLQSHFEEADAAFRDAILSLPKISELWLEWGELYLYAGWMKRDIKAIETGIDKLTSSKIKECDPLLASALLGKGIFLLGLHLDDLKLMHEGRERIFQAFAESPGQPEVLFAAALCECGYGVYFSDVKAFERAANYFEKGIELDTSNAMNWYGMFLTHLSWGILQDDIEIAQKGVGAIARFCSLRPYSFFHLNEWGVSLLQLSQLEKEAATCQAKIEEGILKFQHAYSCCEDPEILYNWGCALDQLGDLTGDEEDYEKAIDLLSRAYERTSGEPHVRYHLGLSLSHLGELIDNPDSLFQAIELLEPLADENPDDHILWCDLGYTLLNLSELVYDVSVPAKGEELRRSAERRLLQAVKEGNSSANYHLACLYSIVGLFDSSIHYLKRAEKMDALPPPEDLESDEWLSNVRATDLYKEFMMR